MNKFGVAVMVAMAVIGGVLASTTFYAPPAKTNAGVRISLSQITASTKNLPVAHYDHHSVVPN